MGYYDDDDDELEPGTWYGYDWTSPSDDQPEQMREALSDHVGNEAESQAVMVYLAEVGAVLDDDHVYSAEQIAGLFSERKVAEYMEWSDIAIEYMSDHYPGLWTDGMINLSVEDADEIGRRVAASDSTRYWWHEDADGTILAVLRPGYIDEGAAQ